MRMDDVGPSAGASSSQATTLECRSPEGAPGPAPPSAASPPISAGDDPLLTADLAVLLALFPAGALSELAEELRKHTSWAPFPMAAATGARRAGADEDLRVHSAALAGEILWWGSHDLKRQFGKQPQWKDIVALVAAGIPVLKAERGADVDCVALERAILRRISGKTADLAPFHSRAAGWAGRALKLAGTELAMQAGRAAIKVMARLPSGAGIAGAAAFGCWRRSRRCGRGRRPGQPGRLCRCRCGGRWSCGLASRGSCLSRAGACCRHRRGRPASNAGSPHGGELWAVSPVPDGWVSMTFLVDAAKEASVRARQGEIQELMGRGGDGTYRPAIRLMHAFGRDPATDATEASPTASVRLDLPRDGVAGRFAQGRTAAIGARLDRIADDLAAVNRRLEGMEASLARMDAHAGAALRMLRQEPLAALRAARTSAAVAFRRSDHMTLAAAAREAEAAAHRLLGSAAEMAGSVSAPGAPDPGLPLALQAPAECVELLEQAGLALQAAGAIYVALDASEAGAALVREGAAAMHRVRARLRTALTDPILLPHRLSPAMAPDAEVIEAGRRLLEAARWTEAAANEFALGLTATAEGIFAFGGKSVATLHLVEG